MTTETTEPVEVAGFRLLRSREEWEAWGLQEFGFPRDYTKSVTIVFPCFATADRNMEGDYDTVWIEPHEIAAMSAALGQADALAAANRRIGRLREALWAERRTSELLSEMHGVGRMPTEFDRDTMPDDWVDGTEEES